MLYTHHNFLNLQKYVVSYIIIAFNVANYQQKK